MARTRSSEGNGTDKRIKNSPVPSLKYSKVRNCWMCVLVRPCTASNRISGAFVANRMSMKLRGWLHEGDIGGVVCGVRISALGMVGDKLHARSPPLLVCEFKATLASLRLKQGADYL